jgi:hypothetical protein
MSDSALSTTKRDNLFGSAYPQHFDARTIASGQVLKRGTVLGLLTAGGEAKPCDTALVDGTENFDSVLTADVDTTTAAKVAPVADAGSFQVQALIFGGVTTAADVKVAARALNCYFEDSDVGNNVVGGR